jgi:RimJ/RimL family protein N-acetyltransferase
MHPVIGVESPGGTIVSVAPARVDALAQYATVDDLFPHLGAHAFRAVFRWSDSPTDLPALGDWVPATDSRLPDWLRPFGGEVLVAFGEDGRYVAGVGLKRHDDSGHELSVGTEPEARGHGLARRLVVTAARRVLDEGRVATYLHDPENHASAAVADASGFPDLGWRLIAAF